MPETITDEELDELVAVHAANQNAPRFPESYTRLLHETLPCILLRLKRAEEKLERITDRDRPGDEE